MVAEYIFLFEIALKLLSLITVRIFNEESPSVKAKGESKKGRAKGSLACKPRASVRWTVVREPWLES